MDREQADELLAWYDAGKRDLPWRQTRDPYAVWVSEVMLQQTQVATVLPYYARWMERFPDLASLVAAEEQESLALWQGLGYYRRCKNLLRAAQILGREGFPTSRDGWIQLPGIGRYAASAIASIAFDETVGVADGNVARVFARLTGSRSAGSKLLSEAQAWADRHVCHRRPGDWNQAVMELGATVCTPVSSDCPVCPLRDVCVARLSRTVDRLPAKTPARASVSLRQVMWAPICDAAFGVTKVPEGEWSAGLWTFPYASWNRGESAEPPAPPANLSARWMESLGAIRHTVTHHRIQVEGWLVRSERRSEGLTWLTSEEMAKLPMPAAPRKLFQRAMALLGKPADSSEG